MQILSSKSELFATALSASYPFVFWPYLPARAKADAEAPNQRKARRRKRQKDRGNRQNAKENLVEEYLAGRLYHANIIIIQYLNKIFQLWNFQIWGVVKAAAVSEEDYPKIPWYRKLENSRVDFFGGHQAHPYGQAFLWRQS
ncbi:hypothetical protein SS50377_21497 [Spironucleus salmonicida]|uniref:Uncharacterized protein n=1 Tax=Spironucleus salmonicida TaxID=348837 RepID=A0A9P8S0I7_9EUKA|nr:hypothetical protein SS50377_21497 [Spironucleus salmonicida]